jgi:hypothetical protein
VPGIFGDYKNMDKLHRRYREGRLVSYEEGTENYRVWDSGRKTVVASRDVIFERNHTEIPTPMTKVRYNHETRDYDTARDLINAIHRNHKSVDVRASARPQDEAQGNRSDTESVQERYPGWAWEPDEHYERSPAPSPLPAPAPLQ